MSATVASTQLACIYSALMLVDDEKEITASAISNILKAAGYDFEPFWPNFFVEGIKGLDIKSLLTSITSAPVQSSAPVTSAPVEQTKEDDKKSKKKEPESDEDSDIGVGGLFD